MARSRGTECVAQQARRAVISDLLRDPSYRRVNQNTFEGLHTWTERWGQQPPFKVRDLFTMPHSIS
jgi:hypothetical protein